MNLSQIFRTLNSTDTSLINLQDGIRMEISKGNYVGMTLIYLQKVFDTVDHDILLEKKSITWGLKTIKEEQNEVKGAYLKI